MSEHDETPMTPGECAEYFERIIYLLDNELDDADCAEVQLHLDECEHCLHRYDIERTVKALVARSCSESAPESLRERVLVQIREVQIRIGES